MKAGRMAEDCQQLFAELAREFAVTLVAGSLLLPHPQIRDGHLQAAPFELGLLDGSAPAPPQAGSTRAEGPAQLHNRWL